MHGLGSIISVIYPKDVFLSAKAGDRSLTGPVLSLSPTLRSHYPISFGSVCKYCKEDPNVKDLSSKCLPFSAKLLLELHYAGGTD